jgi:hypothetical protein
LEVLKDRKFDTEDEFMEAVRQQLGKEQALGYKKQILNHAMDDVSEIKRIIEMQKNLEQRVRELETEKTAREEATRLIIRDALSKVGSKINENVSLGGTLEVTGGRTKDFSGKTEGVLELSTAELDFEIEANTWTKGSLVLQYVSAVTNTTFPTTSGFLTGGERITIDTASITIGDPQRLPPFMTVGRIILPFGISTGKHATDVLTIEDPLTIEGFEMRQTAIGIGLEFPTPPVTPPTLPVTPPPVRPLVINPLISSLSRALGYKFSPPMPPAPVAPKPAPPLLNVGVYSFNGNAYKGDEKHGGYQPEKYIDATAGFHLRGNCGRPYDELRGSAFCPWSLDVDVDYNNSIFDSRFLGFEYTSFLGEIGFVEGMAASIKTTLGPVSFVGEWNGALGRARFTDDLGNSVSIKPSAWQITLGYQFDWNPWVEAIGAQGDYLAVSYSESRDLAGATQVTDGQPSKIGSLPRTRLLVSAGEWVLSNLRFAIEYSHNVDYPKDQGGTGSTADGVFSQFTLVW